MSVTAVMRPLGDEQQTRKQRSASEEDNAPPPTFWQQVTSQFRSVQDDVPGHLERVEEQEAYRSLLRNNPLVRIKYTELFDARYGIDGVNTDTVWGWVEATKARDPKALPDVPKTRAEFDQQWKTRTRQRKEADDRIVRQSGWAPWLIGTVAGGATDPVNWIPFGAGKGLSFGRRVLLEGAANMGVEAAEQPFINVERQKQGRPEMTLEERALGIGGAGAFGAALPVAGRLGKPIVDKAGSAIGGVGRAAYDKAPLGWRMGRAAQADLATMDDAALASAFKQRVPEHLWTPDERGSVHVVEREGEVRAKSPFETSYAGYGEHGSRVNEADRQLRGAPKPALAKPAPARGGGSFNSNDALRFIINDLEGGAKLNTDTGGLTKYGISTKGNPGVDVANLTEAQATEIYRRKYIAPLKLEGMSGEAQLVAIDAKINHRGGFAEELIRTAGDDPARMIALRRGEYARLIRDDPAKYGRYARGWENRLQKLEAKIGLRKGGTGEVAPAGAPDAEDDVLARALEAEGADIEAQRARVNAEMDGVRQPEGAEPVPMVRRELFDDEASWRLAQGRIDSEAGGFEPLVTRQSLWEEARDRLMSERKGDVQGVLYHPDTGPIDVKWGNAKGGLAHIAAKHPEVLDNLPELIEAMGLKSRNENRITLESLDHRAVVRLDWDGERQHWLLSAFKLGESRKGKAPPPMEDSGIGGRAARQDQSPGAGAETEIGADGLQSKLPADLATIGKPWGYSEADGLHSGFYRFETERGPITWDPVTGHANGAAVQRTGVTADDVRALVDPQGRLRQLVEMAETAGLAKDGRYADPGGAALALHGERLKHDMKLWADADARAFQLGEGDPRTVKDVLDEMDGDEAAIAALKGCL